MTNKNKKNITGLVLTGLVAAGAAPAAHADKAGMDLLRKAVAKYRGLQTYSDAWTTMERQGPRATAQSGATRLARPNRFFLSFETNGTPSIVLSGNGSVNIAYLALRRQYAQEPAPAALPRELRATDHLGVRLFAGFDLVSEIRDATITGTGDVGGVPVRVVRVRFKLEPPKGQILSPQEKAKIEQLRANQPDIRYHIGISDQLIRRVEMTTSGKTPDGKDVPVTVRQDFRNVRANQPIPASSFAFTPPPGATRYTPPKRG